MASGVKGWHPARRGGDVDQRMAAGLADAKAGRCVKIDDAFESISARLKEGTGLNKKNST